MSTSSQDAKLQLDALVTAGVQKRDVFADVTSGSRNAIERPGMKKLLEYAEAGDTAAQKSGTRFGRPLSDPAVIADKLAIAKDARAKGRTAEDAARLVGWSRATLYRHLGQDARPIKGR